MNDAKKKPGDGATEIALKRRENIVFYETSAKPGGFRE